MGQAISMVAMVLVCVALAMPAGGQAGDQAWLKLFDGETLDGWRAS